MKTIIKALNELNNTAKKEEPIYIYNVLYKGDAGNKKWTVPGVITFSTFQKADKWCEEQIAKREDITCKSSFGVWDSDIKEYDADGNIIHIKEGSITDYRCEDEDEDTIWYVIYAKQIY